VHTGCIGARNPCYVWVSQLVTLPSYAPDCIQPPEASYSNINSSSNPSSTQLFIWVLLQPALWTGWSGYVARLQKAHHKGIVGQDHSLIVSPGLLCNKCGVVVSERKSF
jgi:hypothetical protein